MEELEQDTKKCPFCGGEIKKVAIKCKHCGKFLNQEDKMVQSNETISLKISDIVKYSKIATQCIFIITMVFLLCKILFFDYPGIKNSENWFEDASYVIYGVFHTLLMIWASLVLLILKK